MKENDLPSLKQHEREVKKLWIICIVLATIIFIGTSAAILYFANQDYEVAALLGVTTMIFQVIVMSYAAAFFVPAFMTSLKKLGLSVRMGYESLRLGRETVDAMTELKADLKPVVSDLKFITENAKPVVEKLNKSLVQDKLLEEMVDHMKAIRKRIERDTEPLPVRHREEVPMVDDGRGE